MGISADGLSRPRPPAGLDLGAVTPEEIAVSILAEIIRVRRSRPPGTRTDEADEELVVDRDAHDPLCGTTVEIAKAPYSSEVGGRWFYFCGAGCKRRFDLDPARYAVGAQA